MLKKTIVSLTLTFSLLNIPMEVHSLTTHTKLQSEPLFNRNDRGLEKQKQEETIAFLKPSQDRGRNLERSTVSPIAQVSFSDIPEDYWAKDFIEVLVERNIISGFPNGTFRPDRQVTRAQLAAMLNNAFDLPQSKNIVVFADVEDDYWARQAIQFVATSIPRLMSGFPDRSFKPEQKATRAQVLVALSNLLPDENLDRNVIQIYDDGEAIPDYALKGIAKATQNQIVVNYPTLWQLNPNQEATRADVAAFIYQMLVNQGKTPPISSPYIVGQN